MNMNRRRFIAASAAGIIGQGLSPHRADAMIEFACFIGTYTGAGSEGIYRCRYQSSSGKLGEPELAAETKNPSFLAISPDRTRLVACAEVGEMNGQRSGGLVGFTVDPATGELTKTNTTLSGGGAPCYVTIDATGRWALAANYSGGNVISVPLNEDGSLGDTVSLMQHEGSSVNERRQKGPHAHCIVLSPDNRFAFACDLGIDKVMIYRFDEEDGTLTLNDPAFVSMTPGAGPRHFAFHPDGKLAFAINELNSTITAMEYDSDRGALTPIESYSTLPEGYEGGNSCADIHVSPRGEFVYGSNRGHNSIAAFAVDQTKGTLELIQHESTGGETPRNFSLSPTSDFIMAANQTSDSIVSLQRSWETGRMTPTDNSISVSRPVCVKFMELG